MAKQGAFLAVLLFSAAALQAQQSSYATSQSGAGWLSVQASPRPLAMAGAFTAVADDSDSPEFNPAGLAGLQNTQLSLAHNFWILDLAQEHLALGMPLLPRGAAALSFDYFNMGSVESVSLDPSGQPVSEGYLHPYAGTLTLSWAQQLLGGLDWGASLKGLQQDLGAGSSSNAYAVDLGLKWRPSVDGLRLGLSMLNLGTQLDGASLPLSLRFGAAYAILGRGLPLTLAADLAAEPQDDQSFRGSLGEEYWLASTLALRAGYQFGSDLQPHGPCAGLGLRYESMELDYAYDGRGLLSGSQQLALHWNFGAPAPVAEAQPEAPGEAEAAPEAAGAQLTRELHRLMDALDRGDTVTAQAQNDRLMDQALPKRRQAAEALKVQEVKPAVFTGEFAEAERSLKVMIQLDRNNPYNYQALGEVEWFLGHKDLAVKNLEKAYLLDPSRAYLKGQIKAFGGSLPSVAPDKAQP